MRNLWGSRRLPVVAGAALAVLVLVVLVGWVVRDGDGGDDGAGPAPADVDAPEPGAANDDRERSALVAACREAARDVDREDADGDVAPTPGAPGVGDPYYPDLGNEGYDVLHYHLDLDWDPDTGHLDGNVAIEAVALRDLSGFNLDLIGLQVTEVVVDGRPAEVDREGERELVVTPSAALTADADFRVEVSYEGVPEPLPGVFPNLGGWESHGGEVFVAAQPDGAATFYPVNDHPSDKACYSFSVTAPGDLVAVTNGVLVDSTEHPDDASVTWEYESYHPMASYLVQVAIANFVIEEDVSPDGVPIRHAIDADVYSRGMAAMAPTGEMVDFYADLFGPYPFEVYGGLVVDDPIGFALETQTLSLFPAHTSESTVAHEAVHQWFGNWVSPATWQDIWLNEGFATYFHWHWDEHVGPLTVDDIARDVARGRDPRLDAPPADPGADDVLSRTVYDRGALTLHVLRHELGDDLFMELVRTWVERFGGGSASSDDFEALVEEIAGRDLTPLFDVWLRSRELPDLEEWLS